MSERDIIHIDKIKDELCFIQASLMHKNKEAFLQDKIIQHAVMMSLVIIGECAHHLSEVFKESYPKIEWVKIVAVRNIAAHGYWQINMEQIWQAIETDVPQLVDFFQNVTGE